MNADLAASLASFAASDLRAAKRDGEILITGTQRGLLALRHEGGVYELSTTGFDAKALATGKPAAVRLVLASLYTIA